MPSVPSGLGAYHGAFELPSDVAYLNTANMSLLLRSVRRAGDRGLARRASPWTIDPADWSADVERLRGLFARLVNAEPDGVALIPATSYGLAVAARNLSAGPDDRVLVLDHEFPSSYYTWQRFCERTGADLVTVARDGSRSWTDAVLSSIDARTAIVVVPNVHWTDGALVDLEAVRDRTREAGAAMVIDASQSLGAMPLDVSALRPDFLVTVGYKWMLGPFGVGFLHVDERYRSGEPLEENWISRAGSDDFTTLIDYRDEYRPGARRFDVGQRSNFGLVPMALAAVEQLLDWGVETIASALAHTTAYIDQRVSELGLRVPPTTARGPHMLGVSLPADAAAGVPHALTAARVVASLRGDVLRVSPHLHTSAEDVDRLVAALRTII